MIPVYPPGPFLPTGIEREGTIDLGIRLRDQLLQSGVIAGGVRQVLADRLAAVAQSGRLGLSPGLVDALLDTWPLASVVDDAVATWRQGEDPVALSILRRGMTVVSMALGWPETVDRNWPMPDTEWIERECGEGPHKIISRGPRDGAPAVASVLGAPLATPEPIDLPPIRVAQGDRLQHEIEDHLADLAAGRIEAVRFETPVPWDDETQAAHQRLLDASPAQRAFLRFGHAGLLCPDAPRFEDVLDEAPPGEPTDHPTPGCDALILPQIDADGRLDLVGALAWHGPFKPRYVHPFSVQVLQALDGFRDADALATHLETPPDVMRSVLDQLCEIGAI